MLLQRLDVKRRGDQVRDDAGDVRLGGDDHGRLALRQPLGDKAGDDAAQRLVVGTNHVTIGVADRQKLVKGQDQPRRWQNRSALP